MVILADKTHTNFPMGSTLPMDDGDWVQPAENGSGPRVHFLPAGRTHGHPNYRLLLPCSLRSIKAVARRRKKETVITRASGINKQVKKSNLGVIAVLGNMINVEKSGWRFN
jgi:hypothetical protein